MNFSLLDLIVVFLYLFFVLFLGIYFGSKTSSTKEFYLADNKLGWQSIMLSIIATETSSLTFLSIPGLSYKGDFTFLQVALGYIVGRIVVSYTILPMYLKNQYSSVYEWIGESYGKQAQRTVSAVFLITRVLADGVRLYVTSIPIAFILHSYFGNSFSEDAISIFTLIIITFSTIVYTVFGGFKAVVMTDVVQFFVYIAGGLFSFYYIGQELLKIQSIDTVINTIFMSNKLNFINLNLDNFWKSPYFFFNAVLGGALISIGSHGVDQLVAQRLLACNSIQSSRKALIGSGIVVFLQFLLFLGIGLLLYIYYSGIEMQQDKVFAKYITERIPSPILGLVVAAILASAMSTLSSSINSIALTVIVDWKKKLLDQTEEQSSNRTVSIFWGFILFFSSLIPFFLTKNIAEGLLELGLKISSFTFGPLIGLFFMSLYLRTKNKKIDQRTMIYSLLASLISVIGFTYYFQPAFTFIIPIGIGLFYVYIFLGNKYKRLS